MEQVYSLEEQAHPRLEAVLATFGEELLELGRFADLLQDVLSPALLQISRDLQSHKHIQMLDVFSQRLNALSAFSLSLGEAVPASWRVDSTAALDNVKLSEMARRLQGHQALDEGHPAGLLEMF